MKSIYEHQLLSGMGFMVKEYYQTHFTSPYHFHDLYEMAFIKKSTGKVYAGNKIMNFSDNEIFLFGPGLAHCFYNDKTFISKGEIAHAIVVFFKEDFLGENFFLNSELAVTKELLQKSLLGIKVTSSEKMVGSLFTDIAKSNGMDSIILLLRLLNLLSSQNLSVINTKISQTDNIDKDMVRLEPVLKYVMENFTGNINSKKAASLACLNEASFCRYFKQRTEKTFSQFVNQVRITHAMQLLILEEWNMSDICYKCGFQNISYFNRQFKKVVGQTPRSYRKALLHPDQNVIT